MKFILLENNVLINIYRSMSIEFEMVGDGLSKEVLFNQNGDFYSQHFSCDESIILDLLINFIGSDEKFLDLSKLNN